MPTFLVIGQLLAAAVLILSGVAKLREPQATRDAFTALRLPPLLLRWGAAAVLPWAELVLGAALVFTWGWPLVIAAAATLALFLAYYMIISRALRFGEPVRCGCFGKLGDHAVDARTLARNAVLVVTAGLALWGAWSGVSTVALVQHSPADLGWVGVAALTGLVAVLVLGRSGAGEVATAAPASRELARSLTLRDAATGFDVSVTAAPGSLLLFLSPGCAPCDRVFASVPDWRDQLPGVTVRVVVDDTVRGQAWKDDPTAQALIDPAQNVGTALVGQARPSALYVPPDPTAPIRTFTGDNDIAAFVGELGAPDAILHVPATQAGPDPEADETIDDYVRRPIPEQVLLTSTGAPVTLTELTRDGAVLLVAITCLCGSSRAVLDKINEWDLQLGAVRVRLVTTFDPTTVRADNAAIADRILLDHGGCASRALGLSGTPAAVLLGADGLLAGGPVNAEEIPDFVADIAAELEAASVAAD